MGIKGNKQKGKNTMKEKENEKKKLQVASPGFEPGHPNFLQRKCETADHFNNLKVFFSAIYTVWP